MELPPLPARTYCCATCVLVFLPPSSSWQAYQDAAGSPWPSSPWPRQQPSQQGAATPASGSGSAPAASPASSGSSAGGGSSGSGSSTAAAQQQQAGWPHQRVRAYRGLSASQFQHPLDQQNTTLLRSLPGLELLARNMMVRCARACPAFPLAHLLCTSRPLSDERATLAPAWWRVSAANQSVWSPCSEKMCVVPGQRSRPSAPAPPPPRTHTPQPPHTHHNTTWRRGLWPSRCCCWRTSALRCWRGQTSCPRCTACCWRLLPSWRWRLQSCTSDRCAVHSASRPPPLQFWDVPPVLRPAGKDARWPTSAPLQNPVPNAYTLAIAGRKPFIVVHTALLELLTPAEVQVRPLAGVAHAAAWPAVPQGPWPCRAPPSRSSRRGARPRRLAPGWFWCLAAAAASLRAALLWRFLRVCLTRASQPAPGNPAGGAGSRAGAPQVRPRRVADGGQRAGHGHRVAAAGGVVGGGGGPAALAARRGADLRPRRAAGGPGQVGRWAPLDSCSRKLARRAPAGPAQGGVSPRAAMPPHALAGPCGWPLCAGCLLP